MKSKLKNLLYIIPIFAVFQQTSVAVAQEWTPNMLQFMQQMIPSYKSAGAMPGFSFLPGGGWQVLPFAHPAAQQHGQYNQYPQYPQQRMNYNRYPQPKLPPQYGQQQRQYNQYANNNQYPQYHPQGQPLSWQERVAQAQLYQLQREVANNVIKQSGVPYGTYIKHLKEVNPQYARRNFDLFYDAKNQKQKDVEEIMNALEKYNQKDYQGLQQAFIYNSDHTLRRKIIENDALKSLVPAIEHINYNAFRRYVELADLRLNNNFNKDQQNKFFQHQANVYSANRAIDDYNKQFLPHFLNQR